MDVLSYVLIGALGLCVAALAFMVVYVVNVKNQSKEADIRKKEAEAKLSEAKRDSDSLIKNALREAKDVAIRESRDFEKAQREKNTELQKAEKRIQKREQSLEGREKLLEQKETELKQKADLVEREELRASDAVKAAEQALKDSQEKLQDVARLSVEEAREQLYKSLETEVRRVIAVEVKQIEDEARKTSEEKAKAIIATSIQRVANEFVTDACVSVISLPSDDMKGRIIGREGRNIRAIEQATGVDLIIDDTPEAVIISCFNPIRREIAKIAIERLISDGRIHPARIDEVVQKVTQETNQIIQEAGEKSSFECGIQGLHSELITALGRLKFKTTGQQSVLEHSVETAQIAGVIAAELELNVRVAKRAALLHDIGKSLDEDNEGHHSLLGSQLAEKCGESREVVEAIAKHHMENAHGLSPIAVVVQAANALSSFRPGARKDFIEKSISRMREMEEAVGKFQGVDNAFVIKSGREVRAMVSPTIFDDQAVTMLAKDVAKKIRNDLNFPGPVRVTMVRETRVTHLAK